ncbi:hypothetical protein F4802DRAFT_248338 [Xylaria palmicola]|nr:hypothetical protein F4802DRAFT_248338 [Xylaria palmicola]
MVWMNAKRNRSGSFSMLLEIICRTLGISQVHGSSLFFSPDPSRLFWRVVSANISRSGWIILTQRFPIMLRGTSSPKLLNWHPSKPSQKKWLRIFNRPCWLARIVPFCGLDSLLMRPWWCLSAAASANRRQGSAGARSSMDRSCCPAPHSERIDSSHMNRGFGHLASN